jgi:glycerol-3-phosphate acyltransferase PlsX
MQTVAVDAMGGDRAPSEVVAGAVEAASDHVHVLLVGRSAELEAELAGHPSAAGIEIVAAADVIGSSDEPAAAVRSRPDASMVRACRLVREGAAGAVVSAGPTGAMLAACLVHIGRIPGIQRPGIAVPLPAKGAPCVLIDAGANPDARPEHLAQFGAMGAEFASDVLGVAEPRVGLLSIGEEASKGNQRTVEAHALLTAAPGLIFAGNCEGRDVLTGEFQVVVADGFAGNVLLKGLEGAAASMFAEVRLAAGSSLRAKIGGLLLKPALVGLRERTDPEVYGGAYLLGVRGLAVIAHGNAGRHGIANAIRYAARGLDADVVGRLGRRASAAAPGSDLQAEAGANTVSGVASPETGDRST